MQRRTITIPLAALLFLVAVTAMLLAAADEGADEEATQPRRELLGGMPVVRLDADVQRESGVETTVLEAVTRRAERVAYGEVVDIQPLLERRAAYNQMLADRRVAAATLEASRQDYERLRTMREQQRYVSEQDLVVVKAKWEADVARVDGIDAQLRDLRGQLAQSWGPQLTAWALDGGSDSFERLVAREQVLILVSLPAGDALPKGDDHVFVGRDRDRERYVRADLVSAAPATDPSFQGETWYFRTDAGALRTGMHVDAAVPAGDETTTGVSVPVNAIVWQGGAPCVYVQLDDERFVRRPLSAHVESGEEWFVSDALKPGDRIVVTGAQMLLSEELRWQIPEEHDD
jgi:hypothetical protein